MDKIVTLQEFIETYKESHGADGAAQMLRETARHLGLNGKTDFTQAEAILICKELQNKSGFVGIVAGILLTRFQQED